MPLYDVCLGLTVQADDEVSAAKQAVSEAINNPRTTVLVGKKINGLINSNLTHVVRISDWVCDEIPERLRAGVEVGDWTNRSDEG